MFFGFLVIIFESLVFDLFVCIDWISIHWYWNLSLGVIKILCGPYPNRTYVFAPLTGFWKIVVMVRVGCSYLISSIDLFDWSKISSMLFFNPSSVDCWLVCILFIESSFIDSETCTQVWLKIFSGTYSNRRCGYSSSAGLWKFVVRVPVFVI